MSDQYDKDSYDDSKLELTKLKVKYNNWAYSVWQSMKNGLVVNDRRH